MADEKKGITVKIDADLHAEVRQYLEQHGMTMAEFVTLSLDDELHPKNQQKEEKEVGNMRTLAFQVPEELFQRIKGYLVRNNITQRQFVLGLIENELDREQAMRDGVTEESTEEVSQDSDEGLDDSEDEEEPEDEDEDEDETEDEDEAHVFTMGGM